MTAQLHTHTPVHTHTSKHTHQFVTLPRCHRHRHRQLGKGWTNIEAVLFLPTSHNFTPIFTEFGLSGLCCWRSCQAKGVDGVEWGAVGDFCRSAWKVLKSFERCFACYKNDRGKWNRQVHWEKSRCTKMKMENTRNKYLVF